MIQYIFDIDYTLYSEKDFTDTENQDEYYASFKAKRKLRNILRSIPHNKYIITNANIYHVDEILQRLKLKDIFLDMMSSDIAYSYKPDKLIYDIAINEFNIQPDDKVYFFEDDIDNLQSAKKKYGWNTILISPRKIKKPKHVDYIFKTIEEATMFIKTLVHFERNDS